MEPITIKGTTFGEGAPKIIVSVMEPGIDGILAKIEELKASSTDVMEWRGDFNDDVHDLKAMAANAAKIAAATSDLPVLFTFRSKGEGGQFTLPVDEYIALNRAIIATEAVDMIDIEVLIGDANTRALIEEAHSHGIKVIASYHNFVDTPSKDWMVHLLCHMQDMGADIPKIAVMANDVQAGLRLMAATEEMHRVHAHHPLLTMAMGRDGSLSRITGELTGSAMTFCALGKASAPGQVAVEEAHTMMSMLHDILN